MDWRTAFLGCEMFFIINCACSSELSSPRRVKVRLSVLTWDHPKDYVNAVYTVQYNMTLNEWHEVYSGPEQQFNFTAAAEDFYGKRFRVRSEKENQTSNWVQSKLVQCAHLHTCAPVMELKVEPDKLQLWMKDRDESLKEEEGGHIVFRPLYWNKNSPNHKQELTATSAVLILEDLEPGQEYCFQVEYFLFYKPHGKPSREICKVIPETSKRRNLRIIMLGVLTVAGLAVLASCLYFIYTHYKRIKALLQPPLDIPVHIEEFFFSEFSQHPVARPASQATELFEFASFVDEDAEDENRCDMDRDKENAGAT